MELCTDTSRKLSGIRLRFFQMPALNGSEVDNNTAIATLTDSGITVSLEFRFNHAGEVTGIYTPERYGRFDGEYELHPWEGHFRNYEEKNGIMVPMEGEVGWHLPDGWWSFWKGNIIQINSL